MLQWVLHHTLNYDNSILWKKSYLPSLTVTLLCIPIFFLPDFVHPVIKIAFSLMYLSAVIFFLGLNHIERNKLVGLLKNQLLRSAS